MENWNNGVINKRSGRSLLRDIDQEFEEEEIWGSVKKTDQDYFSTTGMRKSLVSSSSSSSAPRMIPRKPTNNNEAKVVVTHQSSAPMEIPDWSKIYGKNNGTTMTNGYHDHDVYYNGDEDNNDDDDGMVPPHEWIARKLARNQISSFSVCEGIGRTLKGRDLSKVRNAVLTKTGFLE
ncbi:protein S40-2 [Cannabis sativa]|uniref:protein S40-2 n=1 Tax=Cannabis sativa TaxID=3483 RepID=UPI0029CA1F09|nr:protein S40-2 [Cannabis sativa]